MANDGGLMALIEQAIADKLDALVFEEKKVFKKAEAWDYQIDATKGGIERIVSHTPFAFVEFMPPTGKREGDYDLREVFIFAVLIGTASKETGVARKGDDDHLGISKIYDLVIETLDRVHPGDGIACEDIHFIDSEPFVETQRAYGLQLYFQCNVIRN